MTTPTIAIIRTGAANLASVRAAFDRLSVESVITEDASTVAEAPLVVLPGVGAFGPAMATLRSRGVDAALKARIERGRPLLAICLGMQLLCEASEESPGVPGLGIVPGRVMRFPSDLRVPQMGWNTITPTSGATLLTPDWMYFANSYRLGVIPEGWSGATTNYGGPFVCAFERGPVLACQFHPELSGKAGLALIARWLALANTPEPATC
jgi:imidazole glycerol phosphate synthase glutamine amidotransferase subunit